MFVLHAERERFPLAPTRGLGAAHRIVPNNSLAPFESLFFLSCVSKNPFITRDFLIYAERERFELSMDLRPYRFSRAALSTAQPPLHNKLTTNHILHFILQITPPSPPLTLRGGRKTQGGKRYYGRSSVSKFRKQIKLPIKIQKRTARSFLKYGASTSP